MDKISEKKLAHFIAEEIKPLLGARWLKLKEAAAYAAIGKSRLKQLAESGAVVGFPDPDSKRGDWIFDKNSLNEYRQNQSGNRRIKSLEILRSL